MNLPPKGFNDHPYEYHQELILEIENITNLGYGIARDNEWVIQIAFVLPGEKVRAKIFRNHKNYSEADCIEVLSPSLDRVEPNCSLFGICGGCQYQSVQYKTQLEWKRNQVNDSFARIGELDVNVKAVISSPKEYGYRSKLTPHYEKARSDNPRKIGFLRYGSRKVIIDVPHCPIATENINQALPSARKDLHDTLNKKKGGTLLLRDTLEGVITNPKEVVSERVGDLIFQFKAGEFFQNNPFILPKLVDYVIQQAKIDDADLLVDAYCGGGLFSLSAAKHFKKVLGIEISREGFEWARANASINRIENAEFFLGDATSIFADLDNNVKCSLVIDPPRRGCDEDFLKQAITFQPHKIIYVSCDPATQARDAKILVDGGYKITDVQPFDLFPQTRHVENIVTFIR
jgi:tRNA/tmRNA/rRNA uracil-C5-methylase (TrmA/RlmC/RlmD family)